MVINDKPTRVTSDTSTLIDLVICSKRNLMKKLENNRAWNLPEGVTCRLQVRIWRTRERSTLNWFCEKKNWLFCSLTCKVFTASWKTGNIEDWSDVIRRNIGNNINILFSFLSEGVICGLQVVGPRLQVRIWSARELSTLNWFWEKTDCFAV